MADQSQPASGGTLFTSRRSRRRSGIPPLGALVLLVAVVAAVVAGWLWLRPRSAPEPTPSVPIDTVAFPEDQPFALPSLGASDAAVRTLMRAVSANPQLASWLLTDDLIRRFVRAVVDLSRGSSPLPALEMMVPEEPFDPAQSGGRLFMGQESYGRYDLLTRAVASVDPEQAVRVYRQLLPLFRQAYLELGIPDGDFQEVLARAVRNLLAVEVPQGPLEVREAVDRYVYADGRIEALTPAAKHLYRMGPENARRLQAKVREIADRLDLSEAEPGGEEG